MASAGGWSHGGAAETDGCSGAGQPSVSAVIGYEALYLSAERILESVRLFGIS